ncbi:hypothetical protein L1987_08748 [Smallanthus sonchifolius]|uniref:Uncharacterized protein n=1 Tax=Smallanthus sonchifolius TaxID=185202 RepID=A0ACB9JLI1_9ASTR|nr:hypothetical protein L1987_08748 [Smallanthus sonchifolius]
MRHRPTDDFLLNSYSELSGLIMLLNLPIHFCLSYMALMQLMWQMELTWWMVNLSWRIRALFMTPLVGPLWK